MSRPRILIVDDEDGIRFAVRDFLESQDFDVAEAKTCAEAEATFRDLRPDAAVLDYGLPDGTALTLLPRLRAADPTLPVVILTGQGTVDLAVRALQDGADHFLLKPVDLPPLLVLLLRLVEGRRDQRKRAVGDQRAARTELNPFRGSSAALRRLEEQAHKVAASDSPVLLLGETGAGKGVLARWLHRHGPRAEEALVDLNCAGLSRELLESELFGHAKGAFTGAVAAKTGLLELAHRGTVFLDEIGDVDPTVQPKLLTVVEDRRFRRLGEVRDRSVDLRLIAATSHDLQRMASEQRFRSDLYFRISTLVLRVPPLRERREDIAGLAQDMLDRFAAPRGRPRAKLTAAALQILQDYSWPGNARELRNVIERALLLAGRDELGPADLHFDAVSAPAPVLSVSAAAAEDGHMTLAEVERRHIERVLRQCGGRVAEAAERLDVPRSSLYQKLKTLGITASRP